MNSPTIKEKLSELGYSLPTAPTPKGSYVPYVQVGKLLYLSGVLALWEGEMRYMGAVGSERSIDEAQKAAELCALNSLAVAESALGSLEAIAKVVSVTGFVYADQGFAQSPQVINGASDLLVAVLGERGKHSRAAVAVSGLPLESTVELQLIIEAV